MGKKPVSREELGVIQARQRLQPQRGPDPAWQEPPEWSCHAFKEQWKPATKMVHVFVQRLCGWFPTNLLSARPGYRLGCDE